MIHLNVFRAAADLCHIASKCVLIWAIHSNKSAEGVSFLTQLLYLVVFCNRYLDLFWVDPGHSLYLFCAKVFYIATSAYILVLMTSVFARTREREKAWKLGGIAFAGSLLMTPFVMLIFNDQGNRGFAEFAWTFSIILESCCVLPQLLLLRQTTVPTVIDSYYLVLLGMYRALYILNWILRGVQEHHVDPVSWIFGTVQTALYVDFAWVYYTRQRVKLRRGGIVDADDMGKGWLVKRVVGNRRSSSFDEERMSNGLDEDLDTGLSRKSHRWGERAVSVSADDTLHDHETREEPISGQVGGSSEER